MNNLGSLMHDRVLKLFLEQPSNRNRFDDFFRLCYRLVRGYLRHLQRQGWVLPFDQTSDRDQLGDLAIDILGPILASSPERPCNRIFDHFKKKGIVDFSEADPEQLYGSFTSRLFLFVREELRALRRDADPQLEHLKRRFSDTLNSSEYVSFSEGGSGTTYVCVADSSLEDKQDAPTISYDDLEEIVDRAYHESGTRSKWCRRVLEAVEQREDVRNCLKKHELLRAAVSVNMRYLRDEALLTPSHPSVEIDLQLAAADDARQQTLQWLKNRVMTKFTLKQSITSATAERFLEAVNLYLQDLIHSEGVDKLPVYFREVMPEEEHEKYLKHYKHTFETTINRADEDFRERLRKSL